MWQFRCSWLAVRKGIRPVIILLQQSRASYSSLWTSSLIWEDGQGHSQLQFKRRQSAPVKRRSWGAQGAERGGWRRGGNSLTSKWSIYLTEETRTQLQEEDSVAFSCLILATPYCVVLHCVCVHLYCSETNSLSCTLCSGSWNKVR